MQHREVVHTLREELDVDFGGVQEQEPSYKWTSVLISTADTSMEATAAKSLLDMYISSRNGHSQ